MLTHSGMFQRVEYESSSYYSIHNVYLSASHHRLFILHSHLLYVQYLCNLTIETDVKLMKLESERLIEQNCAKQNLPVE